MNIFETADSTLSEKEPILPIEKSFNPNNNTLLLHIGKGVVDLEDLSIIARGSGFNEKKEFHITVLGFKNGGEIKKILKKLPPEQQKEKLDELTALIDQTDWSFTLADNRYHITKEYKTPDPKNQEAQISEVRESYIQMIELPGVASFYERLNNLLGTTLVPPPAHVTLFTKGNEQGIGINSEEELRGLNPTIV